MPLTSVESGSSLPQYMSSLSGLSSTKDHSQNFLDELGSEASEHARIWHVYNDESTKLDDAMMEGCNRGIDVLLVFTGLFSAVLTTFIIQSYQQMIPNSSDTTNVLLQQLILDLQRSAVLNINSIPMSTSIAGSESVPTMSQIRWVNGLWFAALTFSLSAALVSMLAKKWIQSVPYVYNSPRQRARQRQRRFMQLQNWHVFVVINGLPLLLHVSLLLFFAGILVLLWSANVAIMAVTFTTVTIAYIFYLASMWMSLVYADCPYQHPISEQLRHWTTWRNTPSSRVDLEISVHKNFNPTRVPLSSADVDQQDYIDACCFVWLLQHSTNDDVISVALQAIGGLPQTFTAFYVLREANAISMVLQRFCACFHRDISFEGHWNAIDAGSAEQYCRAWIRLTHGTSETWPSNLKVPLDILKNTCDNVHVSVIATCTIALDSLGSRGPQLSVLSHLDHCANSYTHYDEFTQRWLLDTLLECSLSWELHTLVLHDIIQKGLPILLQLLQNTTTTSTSYCRTKIALILHTLLVGNNDMKLVWDEERLYLELPKMLIMSLASIIHQNRYYGIKGELLDFTISEFSRLAAPATVKSSHCPPDVKEIARQCFTKLFLEEKIGYGLVPDSVLSDMLQILYPLNILPEQQPRFVGILLKIVLGGSVDVNVTISSVRLLENILTDCSLSVLQAFTERDGLSILLHAAHTGDINDNGRLQMHCIKTICVFIIQALGSGKYQINRPELEEQLESIFQSDFFPMVISVLEWRKWWLPEIAIIWLPSLLKLCQAKPQKPIWVGVEGVFRKFGENNIGEVDSTRLLDDLDVMRKVIGVENEDTCQSHHQVICKRPVGTGVAM